MAMKTRTKVTPRPALRELQLSELECAVLGVFWRRGPCSAYSVQQNFQVVSAGWSASPGSIYPVVNKLHRLKLISAAEREQRGQRTVRRFVLAPKGLLELKKWVTTLPEWVGRPPADSIRTRAFYLDVLSSNEREMFIEAATATTRQALLRLQRGSEVLPERDLERLAQLGGIYHLQSRLRWLRVLSDGV